MTWGAYGYPFQSKLMLVTLISIMKLTMCPLIDLAEHALYVAVKQHDIRPPMSKLTTLYPRNLLVLVMEMWETDPSIVKSIQIYKKQHTKSKTNRSLLLSHVAALNEPCC